MLLAVDIGNSNIKFGIYDGDKLTSNFQIQTDRSYSVDQLRAAIGVPMDGLDRAIVCSVVPELDDAVARFIQGHGASVHFVRNDDDLGLQIRYYPLEDAGTDRLVNSFSAAQTYGKPCIVCSFGTALTIDAVSEDGVLLGGLIAPGIRPLTTALKMATSRLPEVELAKPERVIQNTTIGSIQSGIVNGYIEMFEGLLRRIVAEIGDRPKVVATGGMAAFVAGHSELIDVVDQQLTLDGLRLLAERL